MHIVPFMNSFSTVQHLLISFWVRWKLAEVAITHILIILWLYSDIDIFLLPLSLVPQIVPIFTMQQLLRCTKFTALLANQLMMRKGSFDRQR